MERGVILCNITLVILLANIAASMAIKEEMKNSNHPIIKYFGLQPKASVAYIESTINLTCKMENVDNGIFLKSGIVVKEGGRFTYTFKGYGSNGVEGILEFRDVREEDEGVYTCLAYKAGITHTKTFTLKTVKNSNHPIIKYFGLQPKASVAYIESTINLTCKMENADNGIFLKSGVVIREGGRFTYTFKGYGSNGVEGILEFRDVREEDEGVYTCLAYKAGITDTKTFTLKTVPYPKVQSAESDEQHSLQSLQSAGMDNRILVQ